MKKKSSDNNSVLPLSFTKNISSNRTSQEVKKKEQLIILFIYILKHIYSFNTYSVAKGIVAGRRPEASPHVPIRRGHSPEHVEQHPHGGVGDVLGEQPGCVGDGDASAAALGEVDVVEAHAGGDDEAERRHLAEDVGGDEGTHGGREECSDGGAVRGQKLRRRVGLPGLEEVELVGGEGLQESEAYGRTEYHHFWKQLLTCHSLVGVGCLICSLS